MTTRLLSALSRRKSDDENTSPLARCLTLLDLTALGVGATLGLGVYVMAGSVAKSDAGPAVCLSFLVAAVASAFAGLCYAEFASRVPKAGSAYVYSYVSVGEFVAFVIGWNLILEYIIGTASVARGLSGYIDSLTNKTIAAHLTDALPMRLEYLSEYPDFMSFGFVLVLTGLLSFGVKESTGLNNILTILNLLTVAVVIVSGAINADTHNWTLSEEEIRNDTQLDPKVDYGQGGFLPFGFAGVMAGAAKCFFGFVGFDAIATTGEEAKNPKRDIPLAIVISLIIIFLVYFGISTVLTMMWPYYKQDSDAPFPYVFDQIGWITIKWIVTTGAIFALCTSLLGAMFPLPRIIYAMANDGLIFKSLAAVNAKTQTPLIATVLSGVLAGKKRFRFTGAGLPITVMAILVELIKSDDLLLHVKHGKTALLCGFDNKLFVSPLSLGVMSMLFNLDELMNMMSIGTLLAYTIVAICVLILRYQEDESKEYPGLKMEEKTSGYQFVRQLFNLNMSKEATKSTSLITNWSIGIFSIFAGLFCAVVIYAVDVVFVEPFYMASFIITIVAMLCLITIIARQPVEKCELSFKVPWVPFLPCLSIVFNLYLMLELDVQTWIRFIVWLILGFLIYFLYGMKNSTEGMKLALAQQNSSKKDSYKEVTKF